jgi:hypothetical protein
LCDHRRQENVNVNKNGIYRLTGDSEAESSVIDLRGYCLCKESTHSNMHGGISIGEYSTNGIARFQFHSIGFFVAENYGGAPV